MYWYCRQPGAHQQAAQPHTPRVRPRKTPRVRPRKMSGSVAKEVHTAGLLHEAKLSWSHSTAEAGTGPHHNPTDAPTTCALPSKTSHNPSSRLHPFHCSCGLQPTRTRAQKTSTQHASTTTHNTSADALAEYRPTPGAHTLDQNISGKALGGLPSALSGKDACQ